LRTFAYIMNFAPRALLPLALLGLLASSVGAGCGAGSESEASVTNEGDDEQFREDDLAASYSDGTRSYRYVDTHDAYGNTGVVDKSKFLYFRRVGGKQAVGLTMDCAWVEPQNANEILDVFKRHNVKITFFISGPFIFKSLKQGLQGGLDTKNFAVIKRMIDEGHEFGNHTQTHPHNNQSIDWVRENEELRRGWDAAVAQIYRGSTVPANAKMLNYWRAPYGEYDGRSLGLASKAGFPFHFGWNVDVKDAADLPDCRTAPNNSRCLNPGRLTDAVLAFGDKNRWSLDGFVILSHLQNPYRWGSKPEGLDRLLTTIASKNHVVARLSEMFIEAPVQGGGGSSGGSGTPPTGAKEAGDTCAPGCIYSSFCVSKNATAKRYSARGGGELICVKSGDCAAECSAR